MNVDNVSVKQNVLVKRAKEIKNQYIDHDIYDTFVPPDPKQREEENRQIRNILLTGGALVLTGTAAFLKRHTILNFFKNSSKNNNIENIGKKVEENINNTVQKTK